MTAPLCVVAPALVLPWIVGQTVAWTDVLFVGLPVCAIALLLAAIHAQHQLTDAMYRWMAWLWAAATLVGLVPLGAWVGPDGGGEASLEVAAVAIALAGLLLVLLAVRVWRLPSNVRKSLAAGIALVALLFATIGLRTLRPVLLEEPTSLEVAARGARGVFFNASVIGLVLLSGIARHWIQHRPRPRIRLSLLLPVFNLIACLLFVIAIEPAWSEYLAYLDDMRSRPGGDGAWSDIWGMLACRQLNNWGPIHGGEYLGVIVMEVVNLAPLFGTGVVHVFGFVRDVGRAVSACEWSWWLGGVFLCLSTMQWVLVGLALDRRIQASSGVAEVKR